MWYILTVIQNNLSLISRKFKYLNMCISYVVIVYLLRGTDNRTTPDYGVYQAEYAKNSDYFERGYNIFVHVGNALSFPYATFRLFFAIVMVLVFFIAINRLSDNPIVAINGYMIASLLADIVQIRQLAMIALVLLGYSFFKEKGLKNLLIGELLVVMSAQFHSMGWIFVFISPFAFIDITKQMALMKRVFIVFLGLIAIFYVAPTDMVTNLITKVMGVISSRSGITANITDVYNNGAGIKVILLMTILFLIVMLVSLLLPKDLISKNKNIQVLIPTVYIMIVSILLTNISIDYVRLMRASIVLFIVLLSNLLSKKHVVKYYFIILLISLLSIYIQIGVVYQTNGKMVPYLIHLIDKNIIP